MIIVRHGHAGSKSDWKRADELRPLSRLGRSQARSLVGTLRADAVTDVWSSDTVRCRSTVAPLARERRLPVQVQPLLGKDAVDGDALLVWLRSADAAGWVVCTHGEVLEELFAAAVRAGLRPPGERPGTDKGAAWRITAGARGPVVEHLPAQQD